MAQVVFCHIHHARILKQRAKPRRQPARSPVTLDRIASRAKRAQLNAAPELPKFWRPKTTASQRITCSVVHWDLISLITSGAATSDDLWDWIEAGFTYSQLMHLLSQDGTEFTTESMTAIADQLDTYGPITTRYQRTGRVGFSATELLTARAAAQRQAWAQEHGQALARPWKANGQETLDGETASQRPAMPVLRRAAV